MGDRGLKSVFLFVPLQVILAITITSEAVIPTNHKICLFFLLVAVVFFCLSTFAEQISDILQFPSVYNFPIHLHTCFLIYIDENTQYYAINLSWSNVQFWLPTILIFFAQYVMDDNLIGSLWQPMPFVGERILMPERFML